MTSFFGGSEETKEKQLNRLLKSKMRVYSVEQHAKDMVEYAKSKGYNLKMTKNSFLYTVKVVN